MPPTLDPELRRALAARIRYYNEMGIYDFYRWPVSVHPEEVAAPIAVDEQDIGLSINPESGEEMSPRKSTAVAMPVVAEENIFEVIALKPEQNVNHVVELDTPWAVRRVFAGEGARATRFVILIRNAPHA